VRPPLRWCKVHPSNRGLSGKIIHRDSVLSAAERAEGKKMLVCVSRGQGALTLNL
jgi:hypothetical protein